jgi:DNA-binding Lrp family transcriptional regulator
MKLSEKEKKVLQCLVEGIPLSKRPFLEIAEKVGLKEEEVLETIKDLLRKKVIRRIGITLRHNLAGIEGNAMVAWKISEEKQNEIGKYLAKLPYVSHCYIRKSYKDWDYNLYTMIHGKDRAEVENRIKEISDKFNITNYQVLFTKKEIVRKHAKYKL